MVVDDFMRVWVEFEIKNQASVVGMVKEERGVLEVETGQRGKLVDLRESGGMLLVN